MRGEWGKSIARATCSLDVTSRSRFYRRRLAADSRRFARFERESRVLASLDHPNIAATHSIEHVDGLHSLVLQLVEAPTLADRVAQGPVPLAEALEISGQLARALEAAHDSGIVHRDLKPPT